MTNSSQQLSALEKAAHQAIDRGFEFLSAGVSEEGCWVNHRFDIDRPDARRVDPTPFVGALGSLSLHGMADPRAEAIVARTKRFTVATMEPPGVWRYWPHLPPDADSTSICNLVTGFHPMLLAGWYEQVLLRHRSPEGLFHTWLENAPVNDADPVLNANVVACLGDTPGTRAAQRWLERIIDDGTDASENKYYWDVMDLYHAVLRAHRLHPSVFAGILPVIADRIASRRGADGAYGDGLRTSLAAATLHQLGTPLRGADAAATLEHLLGLQMPDGGWPDSWLSSGPRWPDPRLYVFSSRTYDTATCIEAITGLLGGRAHAGCRPAPRVSSPAVHRASAARRSPGQRPR